MLFEKGTPQPLSPFGPLVVYVYVDPTADDGDVPAANATLFAANGKAMIVAITIIAQLSLSSFSFLSSFLFLLVLFQPWIECYPMMIIKRMTNSICGFHFWNPGLKFVSSFIIIPKNIMML